MFNPIYYKTDKFNLITSGTKWLTSTPDVPSMVAGSETWKGLTYAVFEHETGERFVFVNVHFVTRVQDGNTTRNYVVDTDENVTTIQVQELQTIFLRAILDDLQNTYDYPMFICGDFNNSPDQITKWYNSYIDIDNDMAKGTVSEANGLTRHEVNIVAGTTVSTTKPEDNTEDIKVTFAGKIATYTTGNAASSGAGGNFKDPRGTWYPLDHWYVSNFDGIVHVYQIIDNRYAEPNADKTNNIYPSDHLPAKFYATLYID